MDCNDFRFHILHDKIQIIFDKMNTLHGKTITYQTLRDKLTFIIKMAAKWMEPGGQLIYSSIDVMNKFAAYVKEEITVIAEKERSVGVLNEQLTDAFFEISKPQFEKSKEVLNMFISCLSQVEYARKVMYSRDHQLASMSFTSSLELAKTCMELLKKRDQAIRQYNQTRAQASKTAAQITAATTNCQTANTQAIQAAATYANQLHRDLITILSSYAHAQMELYAKSLEAWAKFIDKIDEINLEDDTTTVVNRLKESADIYTQQV